MPKTKANQDTQCGEMALPPTTDNPELEIEISGTNACSTKIDMVDQLSHHTGQDSLFAATTNSSSSQTYLILGSVLVFLAFAAWYANRLRRSRWRDEDNRTHHYDETTHSVIDHFKTLVLAPGSSVEEANKRRTASYYLKAREAHSKSLVLGVSGHSRLVKLRQKELDRIHSHWNKGNQSHRAIVTMCDETTQGILGQAREMILKPLQHSNDIEAKGVWIPDLSIIPMEDMHVTVALPWWWHTIRPGNIELTRQMATRFRQTLLLKFHYSFQIELERIVLLGGKVLVALWRCVGERKTDDGHIIHDRHGETIDPMVRLRKEIIRCFTTWSPDQRRQPLTYQHERMSDQQLCDLANQPTPKRQHTIEQKTPGMGAPGSADGFIHTTLCRLPLECLSHYDVELDKIHRLCREASATWSGHRMVVNQYRFLESMGEGGESNPCYNPLFEEIIHAPVRHKIHIDGTVTESIPGAFGQIKRHNSSANLLSEQNSGSDDNDDDDEDECGQKNAVITNTLSQLFEPPE